ncbi:Putative transport protein [Klebsiella pneumoniae IS43]|uniref:Transport protein n=2 Tax=Klebsiella pneumoniae TaxID=573 RepID=W1DGX1_KLEPN|nr:Putative transport protein [Klebsiella pneumoniae IS43]
MVVDSALQARLLSASGVHQALVVPEERSVYIKIDSKVTNRFEIEQLIKGV